MLFTLGEAYAADGKFDEAVKWELAGEDIERQLNSFVFEHPDKIPDTRLTMYRQHKPYIAKTESPTASY